MIGTDIVVTSGLILKKPRPAIEASRLRGRMIGVALDYDFFWKPRPLREADKVCADDISHPQIFAETIGQIALQDRAKIGEIEKEVTDHANPE